MVRARSLVTLELADAFLWITDDHQVTLVEVGKSDSVDVNAKELLQIGVVACSHLSEWGSHLQAAFSRPHHVLRRSTPRLFLALATIAKGENGGLLGDESPNRLGFLDASMIRRDAVRQLRQVH